MSDLLAGFQGLEDEYYPGSKMRRRESQEQRRERKRTERRQEREETGWEAMGRKVTERKTGISREVFPIGALAKALGRDSVTIRAWIRKGWLPRNQFQTPPVVGSRGSAGRRLWTRAQIERIVALAKQEGLLDEHPPRIQTTSFTRRIFAEWQELRGQ